MDSNGLLCALCLLYKKSEWSQMSRKHDHVHVHLAVRASSLLILNALQLGRVLGRRI